MNTPVKLAAFGVSLIALFGLALGAGRLVGPSPAAVADEHASVDPHGSGDAHDTDPVAQVGGLQIAQDGYRLEPITTTLSTGRAVPVRFRVVGPDGMPLTSYTSTHDKDLHLIVVRRDLTGYQHLHPVLGPDGVWSTPVRVAEAGQYRLFADFQPAGRDRALTLGTDLPAAGEYRPHSLPEPSHTARVDGYTVTIDGELTPGSSSKLTLTVEKDGALVTDLQPYLAAYGHLVALREGDLGYLHTHPDGAPGDGRTPAGPQIVFSVEVPSAGSYRLFLDFQHDGVVRTATFTAVAGNNGGHS